MKDPLQQKKEVAKTKKSQVMVDDGGNEKTRVD